MHNDGYHLSYEDSLCCVSYSGSASTLSRIDGCFDLHDRAKIRTSLPGESLRSGRFSGWGIFPNVRWGRLSVSLRLNERPPKAPCKDVLLPPGAVVGTAFHLILILSRFRRE